MGSVRGDDGDTPEHRWVIFVSILVRKIIAICGKPMEWMGYLVEFILNLLSHNGGLLGLLFNALHGKISTPCLLNSLQILHYLFLYMGTA